MVSAIDIFVCSFAIQICCFDIAYPDGRFPEEELINSLLIGRNRYARPSNNSMRAINVSLEIYLSTIVNIGEITGTLTTRVSLRRDWVDISLKWSTSLNSGTRSIELGASDIWKPDLIVFNSMKSELSLDKEKTSVTVVNNDTVRWKPNRLLDTSCVISVAKFPFDIQICNITLRPWFRDISSQYIRAKFRGRAKVVGQHALWDLTKEELTCIIVGSGHLF